MKNKQRNWHVSIEFHLTFLSYFSLNTTQKCSYIFFRIGFVFLHF
uniref:Uncharacterized protein n=1 Tax=Anguilla anguilla TaxID=7936 RepID=A0A0E9QU06_ANGAN